MPEAARRHAAVFLDRDGTICEELGYVNEASRFRMFPFAAEAIRRLNEARLPVIVVTNQSGVGRGYFAESLVHVVHDAMVRQLAEEGARVDAIYYCPHTSEEECGCRKPKPGMLEQAAVEHALDLRRSFLVGDRYGDIEAAHCAGAQAVLVRTGYGATELESNAETQRTAPEAIADDLSAAVDWILRQTR